MKLSIKQLEALQAGASMAVVLAMAVETTDTMATPEDVKVALEAMSADVVTLNATVETHTQLIATLTAEKEGMSAELATAKAGLESAQSDATTLKTIVATAVTSLSIATGTKVDASALNATELVAKHAELSTQVRDKFKNVPMNNVIPVKEEQKLSVSPTRLAAAMSINII